MIVNLTPHEVTLVVYEGNVVLPACPTPARCSVDRVQVGEVLGHDMATVGGDFTIPLYSTLLGQVENLPAPARGVWYVVSRVVAEARPDRDDLVFPDDTVRDSEGRIVGCRGVATVSHMEGRR